MIKITKEEFDILQPRCSCICNKIIEWKEYYRYYGIPRYKHGHNTKGKHLSQKTKDKIGHSNSIVLKGRPSPNKGKKLSDEHVKKLSVSHLGKPSPKKGVPLSEELKERLKNTKWNHTGQYGIKSPAWKGGTSFGKYCPKFDEAKKEEIRNEYDRKCLVCNKAEEKNSRKLCIHHIDGDKEQGCNGKKWELVPLCNSCHSKTIYDNIFWMGYIRNLLKYIEFYRIQNIWIWFTI